MFLQSRAGFPDPGELIFDSCARRIEAQHGDFSRRSLIAGLVAAALATGTAKPSQAQLLLGVGHASSGSLRLAANRNSFPDFINAGIHSIMGKSAHIATAAYTQSRVVVPLYYLLSSGAEQFTAGTYSFTVSIEVPVNSANFFQYQFSGITTGSGVSSLGNATIVSDLLTHAQVNQGDTVGLRQWIFDNGSGGSFFQNVNQITGDATAYSVSAVTPTADLTMGGTITNGGGAGGILCSPFLIATHSNPATIGTGDSIMNNFNGIATSSYFDVGIVFSAFGSTRAFLKISRNGLLAGTTATEGANSFQSLIVERLKMFKYGSTIVYQAGRNNLDSGETSAQLQTAVNANLTAIKAQGGSAATAKVILCTITPETNSPTTFWTTLGDQTASSPGAETQRNAYNTVVKANGVAQQNDFFDTGGALDNAGRWDITQMLTDTNGCTTVGTALTTLNVTLVAATMGNDAIVINGAGAAGAKLQAILSAIGGAHSATMSTSNTNVAASTGFIAVPTGDGIHPYGQTTYTYIATQAVDFSKLV